MDFQGLLCLSVFAFLVIWMLIRKATGHEPPAGKPEDYHGAGTQGYGDGGGN